MDEDQVAVDYQMGGGIGDVYDPNLPTFGTETVVGGDDFWNTLQSYGSDAIKWFNEKYGGNIAAAANDINKTIGGVNGLLVTAGFKSPSITPANEAALIAANAKKLEAETLRDKSETDNAFKLAEFNRTGEKNLRDFGLAGTAEGRNIINDMLFMDALRAPRAGVTGMTEPGWIDQGRYDQMNGYYGMLGDRLWGDMNQTYKPLDSLSPLELVKTGAATPPVAGTNTPPASVGTNASAVSTNAPAGGSPATGGLSLMGNTGQFANPVNTPAQITPSTLGGLTASDTTSRQNEPLNPDFQRIADAITNNTPVSSQEKAFYDQVMSSAPGGGDTRGFAKGGATQGGLSQASQAKFFRGGTKGQDDKIPAMLSDGEFVFDAETVAALGDGNTEAGASALEQMRQNVRKQKRKAPINKIPPKAKRPEAYLPKGVK